MFCTLYCELTVLQGYNGCFLHSYKSSLFSFICFPTPLPWWQKRSQHQFVTAREQAMRVCVHTNAINAPDTLWHYSINSLLKMCPHRSIQKVSMLDDKSDILWTSNMLILKVGSHMNHYSMYQHTQAKQEVTWTECQHPDMSNTVRIHKVIHNTNNVVNTARISTCPSWSNDTGVTSRTGSRA